jgi:hypothetical protein
MKHFDGESKAIYKSLLHVLFQSGDSLRAVVCLVNIFYYIAMIGWSKTNESLHDLTNHGVLLDHSVSQKQILMISHPIILNNNKTAL